LVGSTAVGFFNEMGWLVRGIDNNMRGRLFGPDGDVSKVTKYLHENTYNFIEYYIDIRNKGLVNNCIKMTRPNLIIHAAGQPSHDLAQYPAFDDFGINANGTLNLLEAAHQWCPESPFVFMSTNKVYGDVPNRMPLKEFETRYDYVVNVNGIDELTSIDQSMHSLFGVSKLSADLLVQEFGRYFGMPTMALRAGCITGPFHAGVELHGFLAYMNKCYRTQKIYHIYGYKGKQVRDNIDAYDICTAIWEFYQRPSPGAIFNIGGGRGNSISVIEALMKFSELYGNTIHTEYHDEPRKGDHICYISDNTKLKQAYPRWDITVPLSKIFHNFHQIL
jgi:CDP-paratose 2-epimerase